MGLALHYANIILQIDSIVSKQLVLLPRTFILSFIFVKSLLWLGSTFKFHASKLERYIVSDLDTELQSFFTIQNTIFPPWEEGTSLYSYVNFFQYQLLLAILKSTSSNFCLFVAQCGRRQGRDGKDVVLASSYGHKHSQVRFKILTKFTDQIRLFYTSWMPFLHHVCLQSSSWIWLGRRVGKHRVST